MTGIRETGSSLTSRTTRRGDGETDGEARFAAWFCGVVFGARFSLVGTFRRAVSPSWKCAGRPAVT
jgi:hypothetical protein